MGRLGVNAAFQHQIKLFWGQGCPHCEKVRSYLQSHPLGPQWQVEQLEIYQHSENRQKFLAAAKQCNIPIAKAGVPLAIIDGQCYLGDSPIISKLAGVVESQNPAPVHVKSPNNAAITLPMVLMGAATDAINPCAFAVLILLLATVLAAGEKKRIFRAGLAFSAAIFAAYYGFGLGLYRLAFMGHLSAVFLKAVAALAIILGIFNIKDYFAYGAGGFVMEVPRRWRPAMQRLLRSAGSPLAAAAVGLLVSFFLLPCTSGPYVVVTGWLAAREHYRRALLWLALYNFVFISPMLLITLGAWRGMSLEKLEEKRQKHIRNLHLIAGVLLLLMGGIVLFV